MDVTLPGGVQIIIDESGQTEIRDFHRIVLTNQYIPGCQISVDVFLSF